MKIKHIIGELYTKFMDNITFKLTGVSSSVYYQALLYLIRFYMLNLPEDNDNSLKIAFIISNILLKEQSEESKYLLIPKFICMFDELIKYKKGRTEIVASIRKRFYLNLILKNLNYIYNSPLRALAPQKDENAMV